MVDVTIAYRETQPDAVGPVLRPPAVPCTVERAATARSNRGPRPATTPRTRRSAAASRQWLAELWQPKDARLDALLQPGMARTEAAMSWDLPSPFIHERVAVHAEIDGYGHVNNAVYVAWLDDCAWAHSISSRHQPGTVPRAESRHGRLAHADQLPQAPRSKATQIEIGDLAGVQRREAAHRPPFPDPSQVRRRDAAARADSLRLHRPADRPRETHAARIHAIRRGARRGGRRRRSRTSPTSPASSRAESDDPTARRIPCTTTGPTPTSTSLRGPTAADASPGPDDLARAGFALAVQPVSRADHHDRHAKA